MKNALLLPTNQSPGCPIFGPNQSGRSPISSPVRRPCAPVRCAPTGMSHLEATFRGQPFLTVRNRPTLSLEADHPRHLSPFLPEMVLDGDPKLLRLEQDHVVRRKVGVEGVSVRQSGCDSCSRSTAALPAPPPPPGSTRQQSSRKPGRTQSASTTLDANQ